MKKIILILMLIILTSGCMSFNDNKQENMNTKIINEINNLKTEEGNKFSNLMILDDNTIESELGLSKADLDNYIIQVPKVLDSKFYIIAKPAKNKEEKVKMQVSKYIESIKQRLNQQSETEEDFRINRLSNMLIEEYNGYLIYISSDNNDEILKIVKNNLK